MNNYIETYTGLHFALDSDSTEGIHLFDIARALSGVNRFNHHTIMSYSVAEHCVHVAALLPPEYQLLGLIHDGSEAYLQDIPSPFKALLPDYKFYEKKTEDRIYSAFGLDPEWAHSVYHHVKAADTMMLHVEARILTHSRGQGWAEAVDHPGIVCLPALAAEQAFLNAYNRIAAGDFFTGPLTARELLELTEK